MRVRPKIMTVATTILGLLPIMAGDVFETGSQVMQRIAAPMVGGLLSSTLLTLLIIPAIYMLWKGFVLRREIRVDPAVTSRGPDDRPEPRDPDAAGAAAS